jgi:hypothetical protein
MAIKKYVAEIDSTITDAFKENLITRATDANMGKSDSLEVFSIYGQESSASVELSRILIQFPIDDINTDRTNGTVPISGNVDFILKLYNARHPLTLPEDFDLVVSPVSRSWTEGHGLDMERYKDVGAVNWLSASSGSAWTIPGGDYYTDLVYTKNFPIGTEDLEINITSLVEEWIAGTKSNFGVGIQLTSSIESGSTSFYTKKFFARDTEFFFFRPVIEAQFDDSRKDNRNNFYASSSLATSADNLNTLFIYNRIRGQLKNIPAVGTGQIFMSLYSGSTAPTGNKLLLHTGETAITGGYVSTGIYSASVAVATNLSTVFDVWHNNAGTEFITGSAITVLDLAAADQFDVPDYVINITNLKAVYRSDERTRFKLYARRKDWQPTIYTVAANDIENDNVDDAYYKIFRVADNLEVIPYGTGSRNHTRLSFDKDGNYFDFDMSLLEPEYAYGIKFVFKLDDDYHEQREVFKFRVED